jgi:hypothetical protein
MFLLSHLDSIGAGLTAKILKIGPDWRTALGVIVRGPRLNMQNHTTIELRYVLCRKYCITAR